MKTFNLRNTYRLTASSNRMTNLNEAKKESNADVSCFNSDKKADKKSRTCYLRQPVLEAPRCRPRISSKDGSKEKDNREKQRVDSSYEKPSKEELLYFQPRHKSEWMNNSAPQNPLTSEANEQTSPDKSVSHFSLTQSMQKTQNPCAPRFLAINHSGHSDVSRSRSRSSKEKLFNTLKSDYGRKDLIKRMYDMKHIEQFRTPGISRYNEWYNESEKLQQAAKNSVVGGSSEFTEKLTDFALENGQKKAMPHKDVDTYSKLFKNSAVQRELRKTYSKLFKNSAAQRELRQTNKSVLDARRSEQAIMKQNDPQKRLDELQKAIELINDLDLD